VPSQCRPALSSWGIPDPNSLVIADASQGLAVRDPRHFKDAPESFQVSQHAQKHFFQKSLRETYPECPLASTVADGQRRHARASRRLPNSNVFVPAATCNLFPVWAEGNTRDRSVKCSIVSTHHTFESKQEQETAVTYLECPSTGQMGLTSSKETTSSKVQVQFGLSLLQNCSKS
jgi:hypothetical protein